MFGYEHIKKRPCGLLGRSIGPDRGRILSLPKLLLQMTASSSTVSRQRAPCLLSIVIASCALLFATATDELFNGLNLNGEIAVGLCVEGPVLLNIWEFPHRSRQSSYHTQFILTSTH
jgi:hypothetical protein